MSIFMTTQLASTKIVKYKLVLHIKIQHLIVNQNNKNTLVNKMK
jgi:hypothetical protein